MKLQTKLAQLPGIGQRYTSLLERLGLVTVDELLHHFPFRYEDLSNVKKIADVTEGEIVTVRGEVWEIQNVKTRSGKFLTKALVNDGSGSLEVVWFNQPYLTKQIKVGRSISLAGKTGIFNYQLTLTSPSFEIYQSGRHTAAVVPIYPETAGLTSKWLRNQIAKILPEVTAELRSVIPAEIELQSSLLSLPEALRMIHQPRSKVEIDQSRRYFGFEELFVLNLASLIRKAQWQVRSGRQLKISAAELDQFIGSLPFSLTAAQQRVVKEVLNDLASDRPMNRLLQGDVGSGKTVVAAIAAFVTVRSGQSVALMAPTEILARQHYQTLTELLEPQGITVGLRTGAHKSEPESVMVGTHALITEAASFNNLGLVVIDEQHRFGVAQRSLLQAKGKSPHLLTMTATPIPRTLALTLYGDLDLSVIDHLPPGRQLVKTYLTPGDKRTQAYEFIRSKIKSGQQAFVITPLVELSESLSTLKSAKAEWARLSTEVWPDLKIGLLHGRLSSNVKDQVLQDFRDQRYDILVATPVVEVGIDIPNATVMVIEGAERFGLSQLHQLRGRVGRNELESWCLLFTASEDADTLAKLDYFSRHHQGSDLSEKDLELRGPGEILGLRQSGLAELRIASITDLKLIKETRMRAQEYLATKPQLPPALINRLDPLLSGLVSPD